MTKMRSRDSHPRFDSHAPDAHPFGLPVMSHRFPLAPFTKPRLSLSSLDVEHDRKRTAGIALIATVRGAIGWVERGFHIPNGYRIAPEDDGSFILLLFGAFFSVYAVVTAGMAIIAARDAAKRDDRTRTI